MKYMTKEWYKTCQKTTSHLLLRVSKEASVFSEDYFRKLYNSEEKAWLLLQEEDSKVQLRYFYIYPDESQAEYDDDRPFELSVDNIPPFNLEQEKKNFKQALQDNIKHLKRNLPKEILFKIADIRILALERASADIKKEITTYCKTNLKTVNSEQSAYWKEFKKSFKNGEPAFLKNFKFHDCTVASCRKKGKDTVLTLDNSGLSTISQIIFKNCTIVKQDTLLHGAWWLYDEIYKIKDGYEIHVLLFKNELIDFIVNVADVEYK